MINKFKYCLIAFAIVIIPFISLSQSLVSVNPKSALAGQTLSIGVSGQLTNFSQSSSTLWLSKGGAVIAASNVFSSGNTFLTGLLNIPSNVSLGLWDVNVANPTDDTLQLTQSFEIYNCDSISKGLLSVSPGKGERGKSFSVNISGRCTNFSLASSTIWLSKGSSIINAGSLSAFNNTSVSAAFSIPSNAELGLWDVYLNNSIDGTLNLNSSFEIFDCDSIKNKISINPASAEVGQNLNVSISGICTNFQLSSSIIWLMKGMDRISGTVVSVSNNNYFTANLNIPSNAVIGFWDVFVHNPADDTLSIQNGFEIYSCDSTSCGFVTGNIYFDLNKNCSLDNGESNEIKDVMIQILPGPKYVTPNASGFYTASLKNTGTYQIKLVSQNPFLKISCPASAEYFINYSSPGQLFSGKDFGIEAEVICPKMWVDVSTNLLRRCVTNTYTVSYCNKGTQTASNSSITVKFDPYLIVQSSTPSWTSQNGQEFTYNLGDVKPGQCGYIYINALVECSNNTLGGITQCVEAKIYPDTICLQTDTTWDKSSIKVTGMCIGDSLLKFVIRNAGSGNMNGNSNYRIYENNILIQTSQFKLNSGDSIIISFAGNNNTIRLEADQRPGHPGNSRPRASAEGCGNGTLVSGQITLVSQDDADENIEIECQVVRTSWDPNEKLVKPEGVSNNRYVSSKDELEFQINFQNTGNDTAFLIVIRDTLSANLDITSVQSGASSHPYSFRVLGQGVLEWTFNNILLPDSNVNEKASHGFVKFRIKQNTNNINGTVIQNSAGIYFDFNPAVITNTTLNTVFDSTFTGFRYVSVKQENQSIKVYPNPFNNTTTFVINETAVIKSGFTFVLYNIFGQEVKRMEKIKSSAFQLSREKLPMGMYFYRIESAGKVIGNGKLLIAD